VQILILLFGRCDHGCGVRLSQPQALGVEIVPTREQQAIDSFQ
jgi:hypothetical protein